MKLASSVLVLGLGAIACGEPSYYPRAQGGELAGNWCSDPAGVASGELVAVSLLATEPVVLTRYDEFCLPAERTDVEVAEALEESTPPGTVYAISSPTGGILGVATVPFGTGGSWSVTVP